MRDIIIENTGWAKKMGALCMVHQMRLATAESCTGGGLAEAITEVPGSSKWFDCGWVTYSNVSKQELLGVSAEMIELEGAVSALVVQAMAQGALDRCQATHSIAISGVAGPEGGTSDKPVGTVWIAWQQRFPAMLWTQSFIFIGDRGAIRGQATTQALLGIFRIASGDMA